MASDTGVKNGMTETGSHCSRGRFARRDTRSVRHERQALSWIHLVATHRRHETVARWMSHHGKRLTSKSTDRVMGDYAKAIEAARSGFGIPLWNPAIHSLVAFNRQLVALNELSCPSPLRVFLLSRLI